VAVVVVLEVAAEVVLEAAEAVVQVEEVVDRDPAAVVEQE
jgi:hypothetical protein